MDVISCFHPPVYVHLTHNRLYLREILHTMDTLTTICAFDHSGAMRTDCALSERTGIARKKERESASGLSFSTICMQFAMCSYITWGIGLWYRGYFYEYEYKCMSLVSGRYRYWYRCIPSTKSWKVFSLYRWSYQNHPCSHGSAEATKNAALHMPDK